MEDTEEQVISPHLAVQAHEGQGGSWEEPAWTYEGQSILIAFCDEKTGCVDRGEAVRVVYLDFTNAFDMVSPSVKL